MKPPKKNQKWVLNGAQLTMSLFPHWLCQPSLLCLPGRMFCAILLNYCYVPHPEDTETNQRQSWRRRGKNRLGGSRQVNGLIQQNDHHRKTHEIQECTGERVSNDVGLGLKGKFINRETPLNRQMPLGHTDRKKETLQTKETTGTTL